MKKGTEYFSAELRDELAHEIKALRAQRDYARREATETASRKILDALYGYFNSARHSSTLHRSAERFDAMSRQMLQRAEMKNTSGDHFSIRDKAELENLVSDRDRFTESDAKEILRVYEAIEKHTPEIEAVRLQNPLREPGGFMLTDTIRWSPESGWHEGMFDSSYTLEERMSIADSGAISFHCHPIKEGHDAHQTQASDGDCGAAVMNRNEVVFAQAGRVLVVTTKRYPFERTQELLAELYQKALEQQELGDGDAPWIMLDFITQEFGIKTFTVPNSKKF